MPSHKDFIALVISLVKRDNRGVTKAAEISVPFVASELVEALGQGTPDAKRFVTILNRLSQSVGQAGVPSNFQEMIAKRVADSQADELQEILSRVRRQDPTIAITTRDDYTTGLRLVTIATQLPKEALLDKSREADALLQLAFDVIEEKREPPDLE